MTITLMRYEATRLGPYFKTFKGYMNITLVQFSLGQWKI